MHMGIKIKVLRMYRGLSQDELADKISKTRPLVSYIEQKGKVNAETLRSIAKALNVTVDDIENLLNLPGKGGKGDMAELRRQIMSLEKENETLKELVESQKQVIDLLRKNQGKTKQ